MVVNWAPHFLGPSVSLFGKLGRWKMLVWQIEPRQLGPLYHKYICIGYTAKTEEYISLELIHWYRTYYANNWGDICLLEVSPCLFGVGWGYVHWIGKYSLEYVFSKINIFQVKICIFLKKKWEAIEILEKKYVATLKSFN